MFLAPSVYICKPTARGYLAAIFDMSVSFGHLAPIYGARKLFTYTIATPEIEYLNCYNSAIYKKDEVGISLQSNCNPSLRLPN